MLNYVQLITTPTADTCGTCLLLHFDNKRYLFGNIAEGTQRALVQRNVGIQKIEDIFVSGVINWHNAGGLLGTVLTLADTLAGKTEALIAQNRERQKKGKRLTEIISPRVSIHGGKNTAYLLATARRFIFRKGLPLTPHEVYDDPRSTTQEGSGPDWKDTNIKVWYMPVQSGTPPPSSTKKRTHEEYTEVSKTRQGSASPRSTTPDNGDSREVLNTIVTQMFDSDWSMDALVETTLYKAKLPAKVFVRDERGHIRIYSGPLPGDGKEVPDIPVLVRQPWPGAMVGTLPSTEPSRQSLCYIVKSHDRRGKFNREVAERFGVAKTDFKLLTSGKSVFGRDGERVTPEMVIGETIPGNGFALVDLPDASYIDGLVNRKEWSDDTIMNGIQVIFWILGDGVKDDSQLQAFMQRLSSIKHIVSSADSCPNMIALESVAAQAFKIRCIDPDRFPLPVYNNEASVSNIPTDSSSLYEVGRTGKMIQFAPQYLQQDDKIIPFPDIEKLAREDLSDEVLEMAKQAKAKVSDPEFLAKIEKVESDIPNRDAEVITLGTGSALPSKYRNVSATLLRVPGCGNYLFDCGENTLGQLRRVFGNDLPEVLRELKGIWISHLHADHHLGTASVIKAWHEATSEMSPLPKLFVASHAHMILWLEDYAAVEDYGFDRVQTSLFMRRDPDNLDWKYTCKPWTLTRYETERFGLKQIDVCFVQHCFGSQATVFTFPTGLKVAYSGDCRPDFRDFVEIGRGATLLIHESTFDDELQGDAYAKKHSTMSEAIEVGRRMGARRVLLTHFSQRYQKVPLVEENLDALRAADAQDDDEKVRLDQVVLVAFDYMRIKLGDFRKAQAFLPAVQKLFQDVQDDQ
ncbi:hypothetical protein Hte_011383 [Hypoxylon texense]